MPLMSKGEYPVDVSKLVKDFSISGGQIVSRSFCSLGLSLWIGEKIVRVYGTSNVF